jgi:hypothetical protein
MRVGAASARISNRVHASDRVYQSQLNRDNDHQEFDEVLASFKPG